MPGWPPRPRGQRTGVAIPETSIARIDPLLYSLDMRDRDHDRTSELLEPLLQIFEAVRPDIDREAAQPAHAIERILGGKAEPEMNRLIEALGALDIEPRAFLESIFAAAEAELDETRESPVGRRFESRLADLGVPAEPLRRPEPRCDESPRQGADRDLALRLERRVAAGIESRLAELGLRPATASGDDGR